MNPVSTKITRRTFVVTAASVAVFGGAPKARASSDPIPTPRQSAGPFYPNTIPPDSDADLISVAGRSERAKGTVTNLAGRILDPRGRPVSGALVEIWQCDALGSYHHPRDGGGRDPNFQGYGRTESGGDGGYGFRTIRPVAYPGRTPHIHFAVSAVDFPRLTTQMYVAGEPRNDRDFLLSRIRDPRARASVIVSLEPTSGGKTEPLSGTFDIVLGDG